MKKLYAFIQILLNMLSKANKEIISLKKCVKTLERNVIEWQQECNRMSNAERKCHEEWQIATCEKAKVEWENIALRNMFHDQLEEIWQEEINEKYRDLPEEDMQLMFEYDMEAWADSLQHRKDREYLRWVIKELENSGEYDPCDYCDVWQEPEACCICRIFNKERQ